MTATQIQIADLEAKARVERDAMVPPGFSLGMNGEYCYLNAWVTLMWSHALGKWVASTNVKHVALCGRGDSPVEAIGGLVWELRKLTTSLAATMETVTAFRDDARHDDTSDITCGGVEMMPTESTR